jgi:hypothetical protein
MSDNPELESAKGTFAQTQSKYTGLSSQVRLNSINGEVNSLATTVAQLPADIEVIRKRNYVFRSYLEHKAEVFSDHWADIRRRVERTLDTESASLTKQYDDILPTIERIERLENLPPRYIDAVEEFVQKVTQLESNINAATERIASLYTTLKQDVDNTNTQLTEIKWICDQRDEASFPFLEGENIFLVATAEWRASGKGKDDPDGILYLTDQRLIFEQKETTGKKLGMFGGKKVQELEWEVPLHQIIGVEHENKGFFGGKDIIHFTLGNGAKYPKISLEVKGSADNKFWVAQIQRMMTGEVTDERSIPPDPEMLKRLSEAPTQCHVCGGTLPMITVGQLQMTCDYCGTVIRL